MFLVLALLCLAPIRPVFTQTASAGCATREACRAEALIAEAAGDFERFHDLSWRAVQKSKPNDPELMAMLARAMARSGRPGDAIVMLSRLADMGVKADASGDEFTVVRTLKDWPAVQAKLDALGGPPVTDAAPPAATPSATTPSATTPPPEAAAALGKPEAAKPESAKPEPRTAVTAVTPATPPLPAVLEFSAAPTSGRACEAGSSTSGRSA